MQGTVKGASSVVRPRDGSLLRYRPHIDGLRAIAVMAVVFFHNGFHVSRGGFVGVDIFFVISGFLIARIIYNEVSSGTYSFINFYTRRAIRILPALLVVIGLAGVASFWFQLAPEFLSFAKSALAALVFSSNLWFWWATNYFSPSADQIPLLHLWSLGVEEQFYIFFPVIVLFAGKFGWSRFGQGLVLLFALSLATCSYYLTVRPEAAFYLTPLRAYELIIGAVLSLPDVPTPKTARVARFASYGGLALIFVSIRFFGKSIAFPGLAALIPCGGAALFIWGSEGLKTWPTKVVGSLPFRSLGQISYSIYLAHWPLLVFIHRLFPYASPNYRAWAIVGSSVLCGAVLYFAVEVPSRRLRKLSGPIVLSGSAGLNALASSVAALCITMDGFPSWQGKKANEALAYLHYDGMKSFRSGVCFIGAAESFSDLKLERCEPAKSGKRAIIWGDSGMAMYAEAMQSAFKAKGYSMGQFTASACPPILGLNVLLRPNCKDFNDHVMGKIEQSRPDLVVLGAAWPEDRGTTASLDETVRRILAAGSRVVILGDGPNYPIPVPIILAQQVRYGDASPLPTQALIGNVQFSDKLMTKYWKDRSGVTYVSVVSSVCRDNRCPIEVKGAPVQFDNFHLTVDGAKLFLSLFFGQVLPEAREPRNDSISIPRDAPTTLGP